MLRLSSRGNLSRLALVLLVAGVPWWAAPAPAGTVLTESYITPDGRELGLVFDDSIGLSGQAVFVLGADNQSIGILLTNTSTAIPDDPVFDNPSDQILSSLYFDLGGPGLGGSDPVITGGSACVGPGSVGVGKQNVNLGEGDDLSDKWGFGNFKYTEEPMDVLAPNFITTMTAHADPFAPGKLKGPDYGTISALNLDGGHSAGLPAISDTVYAFITLDQPIDTLASLLAAGNYQPYVEFGSDYEFLVPDAPPPGSPVIPEPLTLVGLSLGVAGLASYVRRKR